MNWVPINSRDFDLKKEDNRKGIHFEVSMSPYDIPQGVRGRFCEKRKRFIIEFKYLTEEATKVSVLTPEVNAIEGIKSGRLYSLEIDVEKLGVDQVKLMLNPAIKRALEAAYRPQTTGVSRQFSKLNRHELNRHLLEQLDQRYASALMPAQ